MWWEEGWIVRCKVFTVTRASAWMLVGIYRDDKRIKKITVQKATEKCTHFSLVINLCFHPLPWLYQLCYYHLIIHILTIKEAEDKKRINTKSIFQIRKRLFLSTKVKLRRSQNILMLAVMLKQLYKRHNFGGGEQNLNPANEPKY